MTAATLTPEQAQTLQRLAESPAARAAAEQHERQRAEQRRTILESRASDEAEALRESEQTGAEAARLFAAVEAARGALGIAEAALQAAEYARLCAGQRLGAVRNRADAALAGLGGVAIDRAHARVTFETRRTQVALEFRERRDRFGRVTGAGATDDEALRRLARLGELAAELGNLRLSDLAPAEIERRCADVAEWIEAGAHVPPPATGRAAGLGVIERLFGR